MSITIKHVNNNSCQLFDVQQDAESIDPMILNIQDMIQKLEPRPQIIRKLDDTITVVMNSI